LQLPENRQWPENFQDGQNQTHIGRCQITMLNFKENPTTTRFRIWNSFKNFVWKKKKKKNYIEKF
jgi:hypothetical protein